MKTNTNKTFVAPFTLENAEIVSKNFAGHAQRYTPEGLRTFLLILPEELANRLTELGWNVSHLRPREEGDTPTPVLNVTVSYKYYQPPEVYMVVGRNKTLLTEENIAVLDSAEIANVDLRVRGRVWGDENKGGIKAYLEKMYVTVIPDELDAKYAFDEDEGSVPFNL